MSDDRFKQDPDDEANSQGEHPYLDVPRPGAVRPAWKQPDHRGPPTPEEIEAFIAAEFGSKKSEKKQLVRPPGWDETTEPAPVVDPAERGDAWEGIDG